MIFNNFFSFFETKLLYPLFIFFAETKGIKIDYDLRGLYKKGAYNPEEIQEILQNANNAKEVGSGTVKKGILTSIREKVGNFVNRIKNIIYSVFI